MADEASSSTLGTSPYQPPDTFSTPSSPRYVPVPLPTTPTFSSIDALSRECSRSPAAAHDYNTNNEAADDAKDDAQDHATDNDAAAAADEGPGDTSEEHDSSSDGSSSDVVLAAGLRTALYPRNLKKRLKRARRVTCSQCGALNLDCEPHNGRSWKCKRCHVEGLADCEWEVRTYQELDYPANSDMRQPLVNPVALERLEQQGVVIDRLQHIVHPYALRTEKYGGAVVLDKVLADVRCVKCGKCIRLKLDCRQTEGTSWKCEGCLEMGSTCEWHDETTRLLGLSPGHDRRPKVDEAKRDKDVKAGRVVLPTRQAKRRESAAASAATRARSPASRAPSSRRARRSRSPTRRSSTQHRRRTPTPSRLTADHSNDEQAGPSRARGTRSARRSRPACRSSVPRHDEAQAPSLGGPLGRLAAAQERTARAAEVQAESQLRSEGILRETGRMLHALCSYLEVEGYDADDESLGDGEVELHERDENDEDDENDEHDDDEDKDEEDDHVDDDAGERRPLRRLVRYAGRLGPAV